MRHPVTTCTRRTSGMQPGKWGSRVDRRPATSTCTWENTLMGDGVGEGSPLYCCGCCTSCFPQLSSCTREWPPRCAFLSPAWGFIPGFPANLSLMTSAKEAHLSHHFLRIFFSGWSAGSCLSRWAWLLLTPVYAQYQNPVLGLQFHTDIQANCSVKHEQGQDTRKGGL